MNLLRRIFGGGKPVSMSAWEVLEYLEGGGAARFVSIPHVPSPDEIHSVDGRWPLIAGAEEIGRYGYPMVIFNLEDHDQIMTDASATVLVIKESS